MYGSAGKCMYVNLYLCVYVCMYVWAGVSRCTVQLLSVCM
jgi:hypothetical protein